MKYLNQLEYPSIPYPTDISHPGSPLNSGSVKEAGCGLCCLAMAVDRQHRSVCFPEKAGFPVCQA